MQQKRLFAAIGAAGVLALLGCLIALLLVGARYVRGREEATPQAPSVLTRCDVEASGLCLVSFGTDRLGQMVLSFQVPQTKYPDFHAEVVRGGSSLTFPCQITPGKPRNIYCTGIRIPLGEPIEVKIVADEAGTVLAQGNFVISAVALPTLQDLTLIPQEADLSGTPFGPGSFDPFEATATALAQIPATRPATLTTTPSTPTATPTVSGTPPTTTSSPTATPTRFNPLQ
jgi:hypothetical protein